MARRWSIALFVNRPCFRAFWLPFGAPLPAAPPCIRQRLLPTTAGDKQDVPIRVRAPQRRLASIAWVFGRCLFIITIDQDFRCLLRVLVTLPTSNVGRGVMEIAFSALVAAFAGFELSVPDLKFPRTA